jgi:hypothetical protein
MDITSLSSSGASMVVAARYILPQFQLHLNNTPNRGGGSSETFSTMIFMRLMEGSKGLLVRQRRQLYDVLVLGFIHVMSAVLKEK